MRGGRVRPLTPAEARLWAELARSVEPLKGRARLADPPAAPPEPPAAAETLASLPQPVRPSRPALKPLSGIDARTLRGMARGTLRPDGTLDLHGMHQVEAHAALTRFLARSQAAGHRMVAVITGKGRIGDGGGEERGVLRRMVPHWLGLPGLRPVVLGWEEAARHRGGAGALYVRLRRKRPQA